MQARRESARFSGIAETLLDEQARFPGDDKNNDDWRYICSSTDL